MNTIKQTLVYLLIISATNLFAEQITQAELPENQSTKINFEMCHETLTPYGQWHQVEEYGWIWVPNFMEESWTPYTHGRWLNTDAGWFWHSELPWGWLTFHYGNWNQHELLGWVWVPGYEWSPAWVTWYKKDNYIGWAATPPMNNDNEYYIQPDSWCFVTYANFLLINPYLYRLGGRIVAPVLRNPYRCQRYYYRNRSYYSWSGTRYDGYGPSINIINIYIIDKIKTYRVRRCYNRRYHGKREKDMIACYIPKYKDNRRLAQKFKNSTRVKSNPNRDQARLEKSQPRIEKKNPRIDQSQPRIEKKNPRIDQSQPRIEKKNPRIDQSQPQIEKKNPRIDQSQPRIEKKNPRIEQSQPRIEKKNPRIEQSQPRIEKKNPRIDQSQPRIEKKNPRIEQSQPRIEKSQPRIERVQPRIDKITVPPVVIEPTRVRTHNIRSRSQAY